MIYLIDNSDYILEELANFICAFCRKPIYVDRSQFFIPDVVDKGFDSPNTIINSHQFPGILVHTLNNLIRSDKNIRISLHKVREHG